MGLSFDPEYIHTGGNSAYQAVNVAVLLGVARVILLGLDLKYGAGGKKHWHEDHPDRNPSESQFKMWIENFRGTLPDLARAGVDVVNCSRDTALDCFSMAALEDVL